MQLSKKLQIAADAAENMSTRIYLEKLAMEAHNLERRCVRGSTTKAEVWLDFATVPLPSGSAAAFADRMVQEYEARFGKL